MDEAVTEPSPMARGEDEEGGGRRDRGRDDSGSDDDEPMVGENAS
jgi:hypothetical protein